jgi:hypothetical protein
MPNIFQKIDKDKKMTINDRDYHMLKFTHTERELVFGFFSSIQKQVEKGDFGFLMNDTYQRIKPIIFEHFTFDNLKITDKHFEKYPADFLVFLTNSMGAICHHFFLENDSD